MKDNSPEFLITSCDHLGRGLLTLNKSVDYLEFKQPKTYPKQTPSDFHVCFSNGH